MKINEVLTKNKNKLFVQQHIQWVADQLDIKKLPKIILLDQPKDTTFGQYVPDEHTIYLVIGGRHPIDVLRTLSHELTHHKQNIEDNLPSGAGETGTDQENEANANAGIVMRDFAGANPEYFGLKENFADGKKPGRKGLAKRSGVNCKQSVTKLRSVAANSSGEKQRMAHWCANMKSGKKK
jgi:hypothetical protein